MARLLRILLGFPTFEDAVSTLTTANRRLNQVANERYEEMDRLDRQMDILTVRRMAAQNEATKATNVLAKLSALIN